MEDGEVVDDGFGARIFIILTRGLRKACGFPGGGGLGIEKAGHGVEAEVVAELGHEGGVAEAMDDVLVMIN
jgi:hypothetical protein